MSMAYDLGEYRRRLNILAPIIPSINWRDKSYSNEKAYIAAVFSKIAYLEISQHEVKHHSAAKIIPCETYHYLITNNIHPNVEEVLKGAEIPFEKVFVISTDSTIIIGIIMSNVIMIAIRGTRALYPSDWVKDFRATKTLSYVNGKEVKFHTGFYLAATDCIEGICAEIKKINNKDIPIYIVGHSLGGAMGGIINAVNNANFSSQYRYGKEILVDMNVNSCFTFGMPRYGNSAIRKFKTPYHIFNEDDLVPKIPPKVMGFDDVPNMYRVGEPCNAIKRRLQKIIFLRGIRHHFIEHYINILEKQLSGI